MERGAGKQRKSGSSAHSGRSQDGAGSACSEVTQQRGRGRGNEQRHPFTQPLQESLNPLTERSKPPLTVSAGGSFTQRSPTARLGSQAASRSSLITRSSTRKTQALTQEVKRGSSNPSSKLHSAPVKGLLPPLSKIQSHSPASPLHNTTDREEHENFQDTPIAGSDKLHQSDWTLQSPAGSDFANLFNYFTPVKQASSCPDLSLISDTPLSPPRPKHKKYTSNPESKDHSSDSEIVSKESENRLSPISTISNVSLSKNSPKFPKEPAPSSMGSPQLSPVYTERQDHSPHITQSFIEGLFHKFADRMELQFTKFEQKLSHTIDEMQTRIVHLETKLEETIQSHNNLLDEHYDLVKEVDQIKDKIADHEDRSRRCNIKIRGVPESVPPFELEKYVIDLFQTILPTAPRQNLLLDRTHRLPKPNFISKDLPRDVLTKLHYFKTKDAIIQKTKRFQDLPHPYNKIKIFTDFSAATMKKRKELQPVTSHLRLHKTLYRWGFPTRIIVLKNNVTHTLVNIDNVDNFLKGIDLPPIGKTSERRSEDIGYRPPSRVHPNWQEKKKKK